MQYHRKLRGENIKVRTKKMNAAHQGEAMEKRIAPKKDSRKEACEQFGVSVRKFRAVDRMERDRPDLYQRVLNGKLDAASALKKKAKNIESARVAKAKELNAQPFALENGDLENNIHIGDAVEIMTNIGDGLASLVLYSPPYHGVKVEYDPPLPEQTYEEYLAYHRALLTESFRVSRRGGRLAIVLDTVAIETISVTSCCRWSQI